MLRLGDPLTQHFGLALQSKQVAIELIELRLQVVDQLAAFGVRRDSAPPCGLHHATHITIVSNLYG
jgi:hypothetical protein